MRFISCELVYLANSKHIDSGEIHLNRRFVIKSAIEEIENNGSLDGPNSKEVERRLKGLKELLRDIERQPFWSIADDIDLDLKLEGKGGLLEKPTFKDSSRWKSPEVLNQAIDELNERIRLTNVRVKLLKAEIGSDTNIVLAKSRVRLAEHTLKLQQAKLKRLEAIRSERQGPNHNIELLNA